MERLRIALLAVAALCCAAVPPACAEVILHAFERKYEDVSRNASAIKDARDSAVLVAPPLKSKRGTNSVGTGPIATASMRPIP